MKRLLKKVLGPVVATPLKHVMYRVDDLITERLQPHAAVLEQTDARGSYVEQQLAHVRKGPLRSLDQRVEALTLQLSALQKVMDDTRRELATTREELQEATTTLAAASGELKTVPEIAQITRASAEEAKTTRAIIDVQGREIAQWRNRLEFIRQEILCEISYGPATGRGENTPDPKIRSSEKLEQMKDELRLNIGCGHQALDNYINVDGRELPGIDVVADVSNLPFGEGEVHEIFSAHLLEHFPEEQLQRQLLPYWFSRLQPGGVFKAYVPDAETMLRAHAEGRLSFPDLRTVTFGGQEYGGDFHFTMFTQESLRGLLAEVGFESINYPVTAQRNGLCWEMCVEARKPEQATT